MNVSSGNNLQLVGTNSLATAVGEQLGVHPVTSFTDLRVVENGQTICWLPSVSDPVDDQVQELVDVIDRSKAQPAKIIVWSPAGTADDAQPDQLQQWWGPDWCKVIAAYLYMVKMVDELEFPYTVVRSLPIDVAGPAGRLVAEEKAMTGQTVSLQSLAETVVAACQGKFTNESIGVDAGI